MRYLKIILIITAIISLDSCVEKRDLSQNTVIAHISSNPDGLHPFNDNAANRSYIFEYTQRTLIKLDLKTLELIPYLITELPIVSEDGLEYTYELRDGIKWDDGTPLTVDDIIFTTKIQLCPLTNNTQIRSNYTTVIKGVKKDSSNPSKFIMTAKQLHVNNKTIFREIYIQQKSFWDPNGVLDNLTFEEIHAKDFKSTDKLNDWFNNLNKGDNSFVPEKLVGLGPYQVSEFVVGSYIKIVKKKNWYGDNSKLIYDKNYPDEIVFKIIQDEAATYLAVKNQQIDLTTRIGTSKLLKLQELDYFNENYHSDFIDQYSYSYIGLNMRPDGIEFKPFFTDKDVRRAMALLVPLDEIIDVIAKGQAIRQVSDVSPLKKSYNHDLKLIDFNPDKAKKILDEAGWIDTDGNNIRDKIVNGEKIQFSFNLSYMSGNPALKEIGLMIKEAMYRAGIEAKPNPMDFTLFYKNAYDHKFDAMIGAWSASASYEDPMQLWHTQSWATKGSNFTGFGDAESDSLIALANRSLIEAEHIDALRALQKKIYDEQPYIFLFSIKRKVLIHKRFDNANMYNEKPGVIINNLKLNPNYGGGSLKPE